MWAVEVLILRTNGVFFFVFIADPFFFILHFIYFLCRSSTGKKTSFWPPVQVSTSDKTSVSASFHNQGRMKIPIFLRDSTFFQLMTESFTTNKIWKMKKTTSYFSDIPPDLISHKTKHSMHLLTPVEGKKPLSFNKYLSSTSKYYPKSDK